MLSDYLKGGEEEQKNSMQTTHPPFIQVPIVIITHIKD